MLLRANTCNGVHPPMLFVSQEEDSLEVRKVGAFQVTALMGLQLGNQFVERLEIVRIPVPVDDEYVFAFGLTQEISQFRDLIEGVYRNENGPDLGRGELEHHPVGNIGGPYGNLLPLLDSQSHETLGKTVHEISKFPVGEAKIAVRVNHGVVVRVGCDGPIEDLTQG